MLLGISSDGRMADAFFSTSAIHHPKSIILFPLPPGVGDQAKQSSAQHDHGHRFGYGDAGQCFSARRGEGYVRERPAVGVSVKHSGSKLESIER